MEPESKTITDYEIPSLRHIDSNVQIRGEMEINRMMFDYNGHVHNSVYLDLAQQILPEEQYHHKFKEVVILYKHGITTQAKVLLEYSVEDDRHIVAIRQESDNQLHALVIFSDGTSDDE